jgi:hypothetical protein
MDEERSSTPLSLDTAGFVRRACPTCERELMWRVATPGKNEGKPDPRESLFCPYCGIRSPANSWWTAAQLEVARAHKLTGANLFAAEKALRALLGGVPTMEPTDMLRVDFACHPEHSVKVRRTWRKPVHCRVCGERVKPR